MPEDEMGPAVALIGTLDSGRLGDRLAVTAVVRHLQQIDPPPDVQVLAPVGGAHPLDGGLRAAAAGDLSRDGLKSLVGRMGLVVVLPSAVLEGAPTGDGQAARRLLAATYANGRTESGDVVDVDSWASLLAAPPAIPRLRSLRAGVAELSALSSVLFPADLRGRRLSFLRRAGWLPEGTFVALEADREGMPPAEALASLKEMGCGGGGMPVVVFRTDGDVRQIDVSPLKSEDMVGVGLDPRASLEDVAAVLGGADQVLARSPETVALAAVLRGAPPPPRSLPAIMELAIGRVSGLATAVDGAADGSTALGRALAALDACRERQRSMRLATADLLWRQDAEKTRLEDRISELERDRDAVAAELDRVRGTKVMRYSELPRQAFARLRSAARSD